jgi:hypothetical protein
MSVVTIAKPEVLDPDRILENDIDNFFANHEARAVLLDRALRDSCAYAGQLWDALDAVRRYLFDCAPGGPDDDQVWSTWMTAFADVTSVLCGPHGDSGFGRESALAEMHRRHQS